MQQEGDTQFSIIWRGKKFVLEMNRTATLKDLGTELQKQTNVRTDTMRLIVSSHKSSKMLYPFAEEHSHLSLEEASILEGKSIRMMGVPPDEVDEVLKNSKVDLRVAGFDEEEERMRKRLLRGQTLPQVPRGTYVFCDFRTLHIPGLELNPPASDALKLMHRLAADPGIVAIMNKHRWRVGIMTEMAPVGYVGVSPKCILGFNRNRGEEISLRLRTDDLRGFRKYESIKKTLLHELAHMVHSEHDAKFYALDKQLNEEAAALDWTKSTSHTLSGVKYSRSNEEEFNIDNSASVSRKLGGQTFVFPNARAPSVAAAYHRLASLSVDIPEVSMEEPVEYDEVDESDHGTATDWNENIENPEKMNNVLKPGNQYPDTDANEYEPDPSNPDNCHNCESMEPGPHSDYGDNGIIKPYPDDREMTIPSLETELRKEPGSDNSDVSLKHGRALVGQQCSGVTLEKDDPTLLNRTILEPTPKDMSARQNDKNDSRTPVTTEVCRQADVTPREPDLHESRGLITQEKAGRDDIMETIEESATQHIDEPVLDDQELQRIQDPVSILCGRLQKSIEMLKSEVNPTEATRVLEMLLKIVRNVIKHPDEVKFKRLRKSNPVIQRNILNYKAAMEIMSLMGFTEDEIFDEIGKAESYLVLKHNDPGRLWLAESSIESHIV